MGLPGKVPVQTAASSRESGEGADGLVLGDAEEVGDDVENELVGDGGGPLEIDGAEGVKGPPTCWYLVKPRRMGALWPVADPTLADKM